MTIIWSPWRLCWSLLPGN